MADGWAQVLDDLDRRLGAAETGALEALEGWAAPDALLPVMTPDERLRAQGISDRQRRLEAELRTSMSRVAGSVAALRQRPAARWITDSAPVYVDRSA